MNVNIDPDTTPDTYIGHRELVRIGEAGTTSPAAPTTIRIGSETGAAIEAQVNLWLGGGLPPMADTFQRGFTTHYMDPTEVYTKVARLAAEFPDISELITLPYKTNGYQRRAQATMSGTLPPGSAPSGATAQSQAVVLTSRAWGHEGGNDVTAEFQNPTAPSQPLTVLVFNGKDTVIRLATDATGALASTAAQVVQAIDASPAASSTREWATPLTCLETAEQLLRNYGTDRRRASSSTISTSSSSPRRTRTGRTTRYTTSRSSGATWSATA